MSAKQIKDYARKGSFPYPSDNLDPKVKLNKEYALAFCQALMSDYASNQCEIPFEFGSGYDFRTLRLYAQGKQGSQRVKESFFGPNAKKDAQGRYATKMNVKWDGMMIMPKVFDVLRGINQRIEYRPEIRCVDPESMAAKHQEKEYLKFLISEKTKEFINRAQYRPNAPVNIEEVGLETEGDVDLFYDSGAFVTQREIAAEAAMRKTQADSGYKAIQDMLFDDAATLGVIACKTYIDKANKTVKLRYVDPEYAVIPYSRYPDFRHRTKGGEIRWMTIGELKEENPHITDTEWMRLAKDFAYANPGYTEYAALNGFFNVEARRQHLATYKMDPITDVKLPVLDCQWLSLDMEKFLTNERPDGSTFYKDVDYGFELRGKLKRTGDKLNERQVIRKYEAQWIIGTEILLKHGLCEDVVYYGPDGNKIPSIDFFFAKTGNVSLVERCITHVDDINLAVVKRRNALATLPPAPRMIIQQQLMDNVFLNGIKQQPEDLIQTLTERGFMIINALDEFHKPIFQNGKPVEFINANVIEDVTLFTNEINEGIKRIFEVTGLTPEMAASEGNPYSGLGKTELAMNASNNAIYPTFNCFTYLFTQAFDDVVKKWQIVAKQVKDLKLTHTPLGASTMQVLGMGEEFCNSDFNMRVELVYAEDQKQMLLQQIAQLNADNKSSNGALGITYGEYMHLFDLILAGNFKLARFLIAQSEKKRALAKMRQDKETQDRTFKAQQESAAQAEQFRKQALLDQEREKRITAQVLEAEKRKTKLVDILADSQKELGLVDTTFIQSQIDQTNAEIQALMNSGLQAEMNEAQAEQLAQQQIA